MFSTEVQEPDWWWKMIWKLKAPKETQIFMWLAIKNKAMTWEVM
jgi:hypothetical protein